MSATKHTPGPWLVDDENNVCGNNQVIALVQAPLVVAGEFGRLRHRDSEQWDANASLIAAAPELLHELQRVYDAFGGETFDWEPVRAALAKATGSA